MSTLLPFHRSILKEIHDPKKSELLVLARGLGLRRLVCTLLKLYNSPTSLVLLVNASSEEEASIGEELGMMGCRNPGLRVVGYENSSKERQNLYKAGGLISVTSRILVVDMLQGDIPVHLITGLMILHAEKITPLVLESFIVRLYREKNKDGFVKAFTDQPEHITSGMSPLKNILKELQIRKVHIYPRFHVEIKESLERRRADVIEIMQDLTESMADIHTAIIQCMSSTLAELRRSNTKLDLDDISLQNAYFRSFDMVVRRQLDPIWHKVGPKTKQLVSDLGVLRRLLGYLLSYDALSFHAYLETLIAANSTSATGGPKVNQSPWLLTDSANIIFSVAKRRCYLTTTPNGDIVKPKPKKVIDLTEDDDAWAALDDVQGMSMGPSEKALGKRKAIDVDADEEQDERPSWLPSGIEPVLEELPKWNLLTEVLEEIEHEIIRIEEAEKKRKAAPGSNATLIMTTSLQTCTLLSNFLNAFDPSLPKGAKGRRMMMDRLRTYLWWKGQLSEKRADPNSSKVYAYMPDFESLDPVMDVLQAVRGDVPAEGEISEALKKKDKMREEKRQSRRRVRGGAPPSAATNRSKDEPKDMVMDQIQSEADQVAQFLKTQASTSAVEPDPEIVLLDVLDTEFDANYGLIPPEQIVLVRAYGDDSDDRLLAELQPRFIIMFEPCMEFVRRVEVYRSSSPGLAVRVYHMVYGNSAEEHKYLAGIRKEKEAFERMIKEHATMLLPIYEDRDAARGDAMIKTISSRLAGGRKEISKEPPRVIVDMREFRSTLPSLLHAANVLVIPATLTVGDYILSPDMCVERKSLSDLVSSFNSGRLYTQCEVMSAYYKHPILLIEFEEDKAFTLDIITDMKQYSKPVGKFAPKKKCAPGTSSNDLRDFNPTVQSKIVLLTLTFPRVRIIWSSSPYNTAEIFKDLKLNSHEPDPVRAIRIGADGNSDVGGGVNAAAEELLRCLPGITGRNVGTVMGKVRSVKELTQMSLQEVQELLGAERGKVCWEFMHKGDRGKG
ncbi:hypothetical protein BDQ17DRAFT_1499549 [Cyathus striatus]|nr:hypothetical protein BDQ17DRAFT_1499549 [Cyathus striatus]